MTKKWSITALVVVVIAAAASAAAWRAFDEDERRVGAVTAVAGETCDAYLCIKAVNDGCTTNRVKAHAYVRTLKNNQSFEVRSAALFNSAGGRVAHYPIGYAGTGYAGQQRNVGYWNQSVGSGGRTVRFYGWTPSGGTVADSTSCST